MRADEPDTGPSLAELLHRGDVQELLAEVERACSRRDWEHVFLVRDRCWAAAEELGKQLWPIAQYAEYRLALEAPAPLACQVVVPGAARFALGPLTEVVAVHHEWSDLADHLELPFVAATVAQERVVRGEDLRGDPRAHAEELGLPLHLADWEPDHPLPTYRRDELVEDAPGTPDRGWSRFDATGHGGDPGSGATWPPAERAARDLLDHWVSASSGEVRAIAARGDIDAALSAYGTDLEVAPLYLDEAVERLVWAGATGAARGRRRGIAAGRSAAWWLLHTIADVPWPTDEAELGDRLDTFAWWTFRPAGADGPGWSCRVAVEHPDRDVTLVIDATDRRDG